MSNLATSATYAGSSKKFPFVLDNASICLFSLPVCGLEGMAERAGLGLILTRIACAEERQKKSEG